MAEASKHNGAPIDLRRDLVASVVVFLVALPLCIGIAQACGVGAQAGLVTGIIGGVVVATLAGSPLQVSGPAAGLVVIIVGLLDELRCREAYAQNVSAVFALVVLLAGLMQVGAGMLRLGQWFRAVSPAVIQGMLAGIGVLIFSNQFHEMVDIHGESLKGLRAIAQIPASLWNGIRIWEFDAHHQTAAVGLLTIVTIVVWPMVAPKRLRIIPGALLGTILASGVALFPALDVPTIRADEVDILGAFSPPAFSAIGDRSIWIAALTIAAVASAETLLCASAVDQMHQGPRTRYNRELIAQGVGNGLCGFFGGLPMTGVIVRSSANVAAGATSRWSAFLHGVWLFVFVALLPQVLGVIPRASLAGILVYTGFKLVNIKAIKGLARYGRGELLIYAVTVVGVVAIDLLTGVIIGVALSLAKLLLSLSRLEITQENGPGDATTLRLRGAATVVALPSLAGALENVPPGNELHLCFDRLGYIDHACLALIGDWQRQHESTGGRLIIDWDDLHARFYKDRQPRSDSA